jgi:hypothetical protein
MRGPGASVKVADACCGINSQNFQQSFGSFWARIDGFRNEDELSELRPGGGLVRTWVVRNTMHTVPSRDYYTYIFGGGEWGQRWRDNLAKKLGYPPREERRRLFYEPLLKEIRGRSVTAEEIKDFVSQRARRLGLKEGAWVGVGDMSSMGLLVHAGKQGSKSVYMRSDDWIPKLKEPPDPQSCRAELLRKYISQHGPVSKRDIQYWSLLSRQQIDVALNILADEIVTIEVAGSKEPHFALAKGWDGEFPPPPKAVVLPKYDSLLLALKDKSRFMDMQLYKLVFGALGMVRPVVLVDGFLAGIWRKLVKKTRMSIEVHPLRKISSSDKRAVEERFGEYGEYTGLGVSVKWARGRWVYRPSR